MRTSTWRPGTVMTAVMIAVGIVSLTVGCGEGASAEAVELVDEASTQVAEAAVEIPPDIIDLENTVCPVMGLEVMEGQYVDWGGYRIHFCCAGCDDTFLSAPEDYLSILAEDENVAAKLLVERPASCHTSAGNNDMAGCHSCGEEECVCEGAHESCSACGETECICEGAHEACSACGEVECVCEGAHEACSACGEVECVCEGTQEACSACGEVECVCGH